jgi:hypothetical protein
VPRIYKHPCNWGRWYVVCENDVNYCAFSNWKAAVKERDQLAKYEPDKDWRIMTTVHMPEFLEEYREFTVAQLNSGQTYIK